MLRQKGVFINYQQDKDIRTKLGDLGSTLLNQLKETYPTLYEQVMTVVGNCAAESKYFFSWKINLCL